MLLLLINQVFVSFLSVWLEQHPQLHSTVSLCPEMFSCLQSVTFNLASFLELQRLIVFVLSTLCPKVLIYNYACGRAVNTYTSPKHWSWSYQLVHEHCGLAERRLSKELSTHQQFSLPRAIAVCWNCSWNLMAVGAARHQPSPGCTLQECGGFSYALMRFLFSDREFNKALFKKMSLFCLKGFGILLSQVKCAVEWLAGAWGSRAVV